MNIFYGIDQNICFKEIDALIKYGVTDFFLGIMPSEWINKYGWELSLNKRANRRDNFSDYKKLEEVINYLKFKGKKTYITINDFSYTKEQLSDIKNIVSKIEEFNPYGYIIGDVSLILQFERWKIAKPIHVSITAGCLNHYSVAFFKQFKNIEGVMLPRYLSIKEIKEIRNSTNLKLSCFAITGGCEFGEEYCFTFHSDTKEIFCNREYKLKAITQTDKDFTNYILNPRLLRCGLCAIYYFEKIGIDSVKFPSRGHTVNTFKTLKSIKKACECNSLAEVKAVLCRYKRKRKSDMPCAYYPMEIKI